MPHKYFLDTEFDEKPCSIELISIGIVDEKGNIFYSISNEFDYIECNDWVRENVLKQMYEEYLHQNRTNKKLFRHLPSSDPYPIETFNKHIGNTKAQIAKDLLLYIDDTKTEDLIEFWGYYADYDWVTLCWLYGRMIDLPTVFPKYCNDIRQLMDHHPDKKRLPDPVGEHNALEDAKWSLDMYNHLMEK